jgi:uncharacterized protein (UPF0147 family)
MIRTRLSISLASVSALATSTLVAQTAATRIANSRADVVRWSAPARDGLCGWGEGNVARIGHSNGVWGGSSSRYWDQRASCAPGPVRIVFERANGAVTRVRFFVGGQWRTDAPGDDLGDVSSKEAVALLAPLIERGTARVAKDAMVPLTLLDDVMAAPVLLPVIRDTDRPREVRKQAVFWLSQLAQEVVAPQLNEIASDDPDLEIRKQAVFALSQRSNDESVPALIRIADSKRDPEVRRQAIFWLGQKDDPRVSAWLERVLTKP